MGGLTTTKGNLSVKKAPFNSKQTYHCRPFKQMMARLMIYKTNYSRYTTRHGTRRLRKFIRSIRMTDFMTKETINASTHAQDETLHPGITLRQARQAQQLSVEVVAKSIKIKKHKIDIIEQSAYPDRRIDFYF